LENNKIMNNFFSLLFSILSVFSFAQKKSIDLSFEFEKDTLKSKLRVCDSTGNNGYHKLLDIEVDDNFIVIDSIKEENISNSKFEYVFILSNKVQEDDLQYTDCNTPFAKRLLIVFYSNNKGNYKHIINEDVILNNIEYQTNPYRKISRLKDGFKLSFYFGTRIRYYYDFYFKVDEKNNFYLYKSQSKSYDIHVSGSNKSREKIYKKSKYTDLRFINIRNFIKYY
jgi:hypothetical protein